MQKNSQNKNTLSDFILPLQMHVQNHERVQNVWFYPFRKKLKENPAVDPSFENLNRTYLPKNYLSVPHRPEIAWQISTQRNLSAPPLWLEVGSLGICICKEEKYLLQNIRLYQWYRECQHCIQEGPYSCSSFLEQLGPGCFLPIPNLSSHQFHCHHSIWTI